MAEQLPLFEIRVTEKYAYKKPPVRPERPSIDERFRLFNDENPHVLTEMLRIARARVAAGAKRVGAKAIWEELRQYLRVNKTGPHKLDNSLTALYARKLLEVDPSLATVIELRRRKA